MRTFNPGSSTPADWKWFDSRTDEILVGYNSSQGGLVLHATDQDATRIRLYGYSGGSTYLTKPFDDSRLDYSIPGLCEILQDDVQATPDPSSCVTYVPPLGCTTTIIESTNTETPGYLFSVSSAFLSLSSSSVITASATEESPTSFALSTTVLTAENTAPTDTDYATESEATGTPKAVPDFCCGSRMHFCQITGSCFYEHLKKMGLAGHIQYCNCMSYMGGTWKGRLAVVDNPNAREELRSSFGWITGGTDTSEDNNRFIAMRTFNPGSSTAADWKWFDSRTDEILVGYNSSQGGLVLHATDQDATRIRLYGYTGGSTYLTIVDNPNAREELRSSFGWITGGTDTSEDNNRFIAMRTFNPGSSTAADWKWFDSRTDEILVGYNSSQGGLVLHATDQDATRIRLYGYTGGSTYLTKPFDDSRLDYSIPGLCEILQDDVQVTPDPSSCATYVAPLGCTTTTQSITIETNSYQSSVSSEFLSLSSSSVITASATDESATSYSLSTVLTAENTPPTDADYTAELEATGTPKAVPDFCCGSRMHFSQITGSCFYEHLKKMGLANHIQYCNCMSYMGGTWKGRLAVADNPTVREDLRSSFGWMTGGPGSPLDQNQFIAMRTFTPGSSTHADWKWFDSRTDDILVGYNTSQGGLALTSTSQNAARIRFYHYSGWTYANEPFDDTATTYSIPGLCEILQDNIQATPDPSSCATYVPPLGCATSTTMTTTTETPSYQSSVSSVFWSLSSPTITASATGETVTSNNPSTIQTAKLLTTLPSTDDGHTTAPETFKTGTPRAAPDFCCGPHMHFSQITGSCFCEHNVLKDFHGQIDYCNCISYNSGSWRGRLAVFDIPAVRDEIYNAFKWPPAFGIDVNNNYWVALKTIVSSSNNLNDWKWFDSRTNANIVDYNPSQGAIQFLGIGEDAARIILDGSYNTEPFADKQITQQYRAVCEVVEDDVQVTPDPSSCTTYIEPLGCATTTSVSHSTMSEVLPVTETDASVQTHFPSSAQMSSTQSSSIDETLVRSSSMTATPNLIDTTETHDRYSSTSTRTSSISISPAETTEESLTFGQEATTLTSDIISSSTENVERSSDVTTSTSTTIVVTTLIMTNDETSRPVRTSISTSATPARSSIPGSMSTSTDRASTESPDTTLEELSSSARIKTQSAKTSEVTSVEPSEAPSTGENQRSTSPKTTSGYPTTHQASTQQSTYSDSESTLTNEFSTTTSTPAMITSTPSTATTQTETVSEAHTTWTTEISTLELASTTSSGVSRTSSPISSTTSAADSTSFTASMTSSTLRETSTSSETASVVESSPREKSELTSYLVKFYTVTSSPFPLIKSSKITSSASLEHETSVIISELSSVTGLVSEDASTYVQTTLKSTQAATSEPIQISSQIKTYSNAETSLRTSSELITTTQMLRLNPSSSEAVPPVVSTLQPPEASSTISMALSTKPSMPSSSFDYTGDNRDVQLSSTLGTSILSSPTISIGLALTTVVLQTTDRYATVTKKKHSSVPSKKIKTTKQATVTLSSSSPIDCAFTWEEWSECSEKCGPGQRTRKVKIEHKDLHGGKDCPDPEQNKCNGFTCTVDTLPEGTKLLKTGTKADDNKWPINPDDYPGLSKNPPYSYAEIAVGKFPDGSKIYVPLDPDNQEANNEISTICKQAPNADGDCPKRWILKAPKCYVLQKSSSGLCQKGSMLEVNDPVLNDQDFLDTLSNSEPLIFETVDEDPQDCWGPCSVTCGFGKRANIKKHSECSYLPSLQVCSPRHCAIDCKVSWGSWGMCSASCGTGKQFRGRKVRVKPAYGGKACPDIQEQACNTEACPTYPADWTSTTVSTTPRRTTTSTTVFMTTTPVFPLDEVEEVVADIMQTLGCSFLLVSLSITLVAFLAMRDFSHERIIHMNMELALLIGHILVLTMRDRTDLPTVCKLVSIGFQYFFLTSAAFMSLEALQAYSVASNIISSGGYFTKLQFCIIGWGAPAAITGFSAMLKHKEYTSFWSCWVNLGSSASLATVIPMIFFTSITIVMVEAAGMDDKEPLPSTNRNQATAALANTKGLLFILPCSIGSWFFGLFAVYYVNIAMFSVVSALNMSLGISIFVFHSLGNPKILAKFKQLMSKCKGK